VYPNKDTLAHALTVSEAGEAGEAWEDKLVKNCRWTLMCHDMVPLVN